MSTVDCLKCGNPAHRSRSRGFMEVIIKSITSNRKYHCHKCGWRGWLVKKTFVAETHYLRTVLIFFLILLLTIVGAFYLTRNMIQNNSVIQSQPSQ